MPKTEAIRMSKALVTGGAGFIGCHVADHFAKSHDEVVIYDNFSRTKMLGSVVKDHTLNWLYLTKRHSNITLLRKMFGILKPLDRRARAQMSLFTAQAK
jgi:dTDP-D-glucose 4,6-dehydratase